MKGKGRLFALCVVAGVLGQYRHCRERGGHADDQLLEPVHAPSSTRTSRNMPDSMWKNRWQW